MATVTGMLALLDTATAQQALGYLGCGIVVAMFSGPLAVIKTVIDTESTKDLPFPMVSRRLVAAPVALTGSSSVFGRRWPLL